jgi:hypothetical protein
LNFKKKHLFGIKPYYSKLKLKNICRRRTGIYKPIIKPQNAKSSVSEVIGISKPLYNHPAPLF